MRTKGTSFRKVVVCSTNDFDDHRNSRMKGWIEHAGGTFRKDLDSSVTHLIVSKKAWKHYIPIVKEARRMRSIYIVNYDWLEDSLMRTPIRALPVDKYLWEQTKLKPMKKTKSQSQSMDKNEHLESGKKKIAIPKEKRIEVEGVQFNQAIEEFKEDVGEAGFHPYSDTTGFVYVVALLRHDIIKNQFDKHKLKVGALPPSFLLDVIPGHYTQLHFFPSHEPYGAAPVAQIRRMSYHKRSLRVHHAEPWAQCLQLFESDQKPRTYACYTQYTRPGIRKQVLTLAPPGSTWEFAWTMFQKFFKQKVGISWTERSENGLEINLDGETQLEHFQYRSPRIGEPEGLRGSDMLPAATLGTSTEGAGKIQRSKDVGHNEESADTANKGHIPTTKSAVVKELEEHSDSEISDHRSSPEIDDTHHP